MQFRIDMSLDDTGDLVLRQVLGSGGEPLLDEYGDPYHDFEIAQDRQVVIQGSVCRVRTQLSDWYTYPMLGADLEKFIGELNNPETAELIINSIRHAHTYDFFIKNEDLDIYAVPINRNEVIFYIRLEYQHSEPIVFALPFNYNEGLGGQ